jgi:hypothetical protein
LSRNNALHRAKHANSAHECSGINAGHGYDAMLLKIILQTALSAKVTGTAAVLAHDESGQMRASAFEILVIHSVITNFRIRHRDNLAAITGIRQDLLVARH